MKIQFLDLENRNVVAMVIVVEAMIAEMFVPYLKALPADQRQAACDRVVAQVAANGKAIVDLAPKTGIDNAMKIQGASARMVKAAMTESLAEIAKT
jgi:hypothetical protein